MAHPETPSAPPEAPESGPGSARAFRGPLPPRSRRRYTRTRRIVYHTAGPLIAGLGGFLASTWRLRRVAGEERALALVRTGRPVVPCFWHHQLAIGTSYLLRLRRHGLALGALVSPSLDGELGAQIARRLGLHVVRGSATRTGVRAMLALYRAVRRDAVSPLMLPDGPTGPIRVFKPGAVRLSQLADAPLLPIGCATRPAPGLPTWDRTLLPPPFARLAIVIGEPRSFPRTLAPDAFEAARLDMERTLCTLEAQAQAALDGPPAARVR